MIFFRHLNFSNFPFEVDRNPNPIIDKLDAQPRTIKIRNESNQPLITYVKWTRREDEGNETKRNEMKTTKITGHSGHSGHLCVLAPLNFNYTQNTRKPHSHTRSHANRYLYLYEKWRYTTFIRRPFRAVKLFMAQTKINLQWNSRSRIVNGTIERADIEKLLCDALRWNNMSGGAGSVPVFNHWQRHTGRLERKREVFVYKWNFFERVSERVSEREKRY